MWEFPVFVRSKDSGDVKSYDSVEDMCRQFERIDIENREYEAWDATGLPLNLSVRNSGQWLQLEPADQAQPEQLARAIAEFATSQNVHVDASFLFAGGFSAALAAVQVKRHTQNWWQRFKGRF